jgi:hypothetical protein
MFSAFFKSLSEIGNNIFVVVQKFSQDLKIQIKQDQF